MPTVQSLNARRATSSAALAVITLTTAASAQHDHSLVQAGRDSAGRLHMHTHAPMPFEVEPSPFPEFQGFATAEVALESLMDDHPAIDLFLLAPTCDIRAVLISADPGMRVFDGLNELSPGEEITLGPPVFHYLPIWNISPGAIGQTYELRMKFRDASGLYAESDVFTLSFTPVPAPAGAALAITALAALATRRRRA